MNNENLKAFSIHFENKPTGCSLKRKWKYEKFRIKIPVYNARNRHGSAWRQGIGSCLII